MSPEHFLICSVLNYKIKRRSKKNISLTVSKTNNSL